MRPLSPLSFALGPSTDPLPLVDRSEFTRPWWTWLVLTGVFLSLTISCKMVGLFAFLAVGTAVIVDLWNILDVRRGHSMVRLSLPLSPAAFLPRLPPPRQSAQLTRHVSPPQDYVGRHFFARVVGLILVPACVYLFWFWVHFAVLTRSGSGDDFMSPAFQQTLLDSPLTALAEGACAVSDGLESVPPRARD